MWLYAATKGDFIEPEKLISQEYMSKPKFGTLLADGEMLKPFGQYIAAEARLAGRQPSMPIADEAVQRIAAYTASLLGG